MKLHLNPQTGFTVINFNFLKKKIINLNLEIKRLIGCLHDDPDIESEKKSLTYNFIRGTNGEILIEVENNGQKLHILPEEVCARILHRLKVDAEMYLGEPLKHAVITVPAYFNNNQRAATRDAAKIAGFYFYFLS